MRLSEPRVTPLAEAEWQPEQAEIFEKARDLNGRVYNIFLTVGRHTKLLKRWLPFANHILFKSSLSPRERELLILRIGWLCQAEYEWGQHVEIARRADITDEEIARIKQGSDAPGWTRIEAALLRATDELRADAIIGEATWTELSAHYDDNQLMDIVFTVGQYNLVSMALNTLGVRLDDGLKGFDG